MLRRVLWPHLRSTGGKARRQSPWKPWLALALAMALGVGVNYLGCQKQEKEPTGSGLSPRETKNLLERHLDQDSLARLQNCAGISIDGKQYLLAVFKRMANSQGARLLEIHRGQVRDYPLQGEMSGLGSLRFGTPRLAEVSGDGIPEIIYAETSSGSQGGQHAVWVLDIPHKMVLHGSLFWYFDAFQDDKEIEWSKNSGTNEKIKKYILAELENFYNQEFSEYLNSPTYKMKQHWKKVNGIECSQLNKPCQVKLLWIQVPDEKKFFYWSKDKVVENHNYKLLFMFKSGVFMIDKNNKKAALLYLPPYNSKFHDIKLTDKFISFAIGNKNIKYDFKEHLLKKTN